MGKHRTRIEFNPDALKKALDGVESFSDRADKFGVTRQAINGWFSEGLIPPRALAEIVRDLNLSVETVTEILSPIIKKKKKIEGPRRRYTVTIEVDEHIYDDEDTT